MKNKLITFWIIVGIVLVSLWIIITKPTKLGLDLVGGSRLVLEAAPANGVVTPDMMSSLQFAIENRVNGLGVAETVVHRMGDKRLVVEIPAVSDLEQAKAFIGETAELEFKEPVMENGQYVFINGEQQWKSTGLTGKDLDKAMVGSDSRTGQWSVQLEFNTEGTKKFAELTKRLVGKPMAIFFNGKLESAPNINEPIPSGHAQITGGEGGFAIEEAKKMVDLLNAGALPVPAKIIEENTVGPTLGADSIAKSKVAGAIGLGFVMIFMALYYRAPGLIADLALIIYGIILFAIFKWIPVTLTLAGIAGFILSIGMAVDANILIFERTKEELKSGKRLLTAVKTGFDRAFTSIFDSNMTTMITCAILYMYGTSIVKGFALTLAIGVAISMFTAITVSRSLMEVVIGADHMKHPEWFGLKASEVSENIVEEQAAGKAKLGVLD